VYAGDLALSADAEDDESLALTLLERQPWKARRRAKNVQVPLPTALPGTVRFTSDAGSPATRMAPGPTDSEHLSPSPASTPLTPVVSTAANIFGLSRHYFSQTMPLHDPEVDVTSSDLTDAQDLPPLESTSLGPYPNFNSLLLSDWYWNQGTKSVKDFDSLVKIVGSESFRPEDVRDTKWSKINIALSGDSELVEDEAGWLHVSVTISVPFHTRRVASRDQARDQRTAPLPYIVRGFRYRKLLSVIRETLTNPVRHAQFHYQPFELRWTPFRSFDLDEAQTEFRVYSELYNSESFLQAHKDLQALPPVPGCSLERVIVALMFWSDATHLTSFGDAKLHPVYLFFGNESKYLRARPSLNLGAHIAYFCQVKIHLFYRVPTVLLTDNLRSFQTALLKFHALRPQTGWLQAKLSLPIVLVSFFMLSGI
jgi:hypothetical protein